MSSDADEDLLPEDDEATAEAVEAAVAAVAAVLPLGPELTISHAAAVRDTLADALHGSGDRVIDLSGVTDIDSAGVQLLLAARRSLASRGDTLRVTAATTTVLEALTVFGLQSLLIEAADTVSV